MQLLKDKENPTPVTDIAMTPGILADHQIRALAEGQGMIEPFVGHVTLEISNTTPLPAKVYANEGIAQFLFFKGSDACEVSYADKGGKYMGQRGVTLPKL